MTQEVFPSEDIRKERISRYQERHQRKLEMAKVRRLERKELEKKILDFKIPVIECPLGCRPIYLASSPSECEAIAKQLGLDRRGKWDLEYMSLYHHLNSHHAREDVSNLLSQRVIEADEKRRENESELFPQDITALREALYWSKESYIQKARKYAFGEKMGDGYHQKIDGYYENDYLPKLKWFDEIDIKLKRLNK